jgi:hypothetical protein
MDRPLDVVVEPLSPRGSREFDALHRSIPSQNEASLALAGETATGRLGGIGPFRLDPALDLSKVLTIAWVRCIDPAGDLGRVRRLGWRERRII